jgi:hypothetical protein
MISGESGDRRFVDLLMEHPIIASYKSPHFSRTGKETAPSYVPSNLFAKALLHMVLTTAADSKVAVANADQAPAQEGDGTTKTDPTDKAFAWRTDDLVKALETKDTIIPEYLRKVLEPMIQSAQRDMDLLERTIANWFDTSMDRTTGWYRRWATMLVLLFTTLATVTLNIDSLEILRVVSTDAKVRRELSDLGVGVANRNSRALTLAQQTAFVKAMDRPSVQELLGPGLPEKGDTAVLATAAPAAAPASGTAPTSVVPKMVSDVQAADLRRMAQTAADIQLLMAVSPEHLAFVREVRTASDSDDLAARVKELCSRSRRCTPNAVFPPRPFQKDITPEKASEVCGNKAYYVDFWASGENVWNAQLAGALERFLQSVQGASAPCGRDTSKPGSLEDQRTTLLLLRKEMALALPKAQESADMIGDMLSRFEFISIERGMLSYRYAIKNRLNLFELHLIPKWWYPLATPLFESVPIKHDYPSTRQFLGWLITILMVSFGAPFWYDLLSKLANLRPTGPKPAQTPDPTP